MTPPRPRRIEGVVITERIKKCDREKQTAAEFVEITNVPYFLTSNRTPLHDP